MSSGYQCEDGDNIDYYFAGVESGSVNETFMRSVL